MEEEEEEKVKEKSGIDSKALDAKEDGGVIYSFREVILIY